MPVENDLSICFKCAGWSKYDKDLKLVPFTKEDREKTSPELLAEMEKYSDRVRFMNNSNNQSMQPQFKQLENHNDEELIKLAKDLFGYASHELQDLRKTFSRTPEELVANESFYRALIATSSEYLTAKQHWYQAYERTDQSSGDFPPSIPSGECTDPTDNLGE